LKSGISAPFSAILDLLPICGILLLVFLFVADY